LTFYGLDRSQERTFHKKKQTSLVWLRAVGHTAKREIERNKSRTLEVNAGKLLAV
jgi:hypothetical protein